MAFVVSIHDDALAGVASSLVSLSLHTADPGSTGANEVSGGTYARGSLSWNANTGSGSMSANLSITGLPGSITVGWIGFWDSSGTWRGGYVTSQPETWNNAGGTADVSVTVTSSNGA